MKPACMPAPAPIPGRLAITVFLLLACAPAAASNGFKVIGQGIESIGLGGGDIAVARDSYAIDSNPAGLTQIGGARFDGYVAPFYYTHLKHSDPLNRERHLNDRLGALASAAYARQAFAPGLTVGLGFFVSGGTGFGYNNLNTVFGTVDDYSVVLGVSKLAGGLAWRVNENLSIGANLGLSYAQLRQKVFPSTSNAAAGFFGLRLDGLDGLSLNTRVGLMMQPVASLKIGLSYATATEIRLQNGTARVDYSDLGFGKVDYADASVSGFAFPQELGLGLRWQFTPRWMLVSEVNWLDWSASLKDATVQLKRPDHADAPQQVDAAQPLNHRDQYVFSLGAAYTWDERTTLRMGTNLSRNPVPRDTLTPTLNVTEDTEFDIGLSRKLGPRWEFGSAIQWQVYKSVRYDNALFGQNAREDFGVVVWHLQMTRRW